MQRDGSTAVLTGPPDEREHRDEERFLVDQRRQADEAKAQQAREQLEKLREAEVRASRMRAGRCVLCGAPLSKILRSLGSARHPRCRLFRE